MINGQKILSWSKKNRYLLLVIIIFLILNNLPYLAGWLKAILDSSITFNGSPIINEGDYFVYLSFIEQGQQGHLWLRNLYDYQGQNYVLLAPIWYLIGQFSQLTTISPIISYHVFRLALTVCFIAVLWWWLKQIFSNYQKRVLILGAVLFTNGLGVLFLNIWPNLGLSPINLWVPEAITFLNLFYAPHFILSQTLMLLVLGLFIKSINTKQLHLAWYYLPLSLLLYVIHPYDLVTITILLTIWSIIQFYQTKDKKIILVLIYIYLMAGIAGGYYLWLFTDPSMAQYKTQNIVASRHFLEYLFGLGIISILSLAGFYYLIKKQLLKNSYLLLMAIWTILGWILIYLPFSFNRRLSNGWQIALVIMSLIFIKYVYRRWPALIRGGLIALLFILLCFDTIYHISLYTATIYQNNTYNFPYINQGRQTFYNQIEQLTTEDSIILTRGVEGNRLPAFTGLRVYMGHDIQTWQAKEKNQEVIDLWSKENDIRSWLENKQINFIVASHQYIPEFDDIRWLANQPYIKPIIDNNQFILYQVIY